MNMAEKLALNLVSEAEPIYYAVDPFSAPQQQESAALDEVALPEEGNYASDDIETLLQSLFEDDEEKQEEAPHEEEGEAAFELSDDGGDIEADAPGISLEETGLDKGIGGEPVFELDLADDALAPEPQDDNAFDFLDQDDGMLPGAKIILHKDDEEPERETNWEEDQDHSKFIPFMLDRMKAIPAHSGQTTVGCEKAISYLRKLDKEISKAIQGDENNSIDETQAEKLRDKIHQYVDMLEDALDGLVSKKRKKKKKASFSLGKKVYARINNGQDIQYFISVFSSDDEERLFKVDVEEPNDAQVQAFMAGEGEGLTKEAGKLVTFVDPFLQSITRLIIRSHITQGKNIQDVYAQLNDQYTFTDREQLSIHEILMQKGLPLNADLGRLQEKDVSPMDSKNVEYSTEFYS